MTVTLEWHDTLTIDPSGSGVTVDGPCADGVPLDDSNLVARALRHVAQLPMTGKAWEELKSQADQPAGTLTIPWPFKSWPGGQRF